MARISARILTVVLVTFVLASAQAPHKSPHRTEPSTTEIILIPSGNALLEFCSARKVEVGDMVEPAVLVKGARDNGMCGGYIAGVSDAMAGYQAVGSPRIYCSPSGVTLIQLVAVVKKWFEDNPSQLHQPAVSLVMRALSEAFPCK